MRCLVLFLAAFSLTVPVRAEYLYKAMMVRAAPAHLTRLIELYRGHMAFYDAAGDERPFWMRHSQGDQWDLLFLFPMKSFSDYYSESRQTRRRKAAEELGLDLAEFRKRFYELTAWHEDVFVEGPGLEEVRRRFEGSGFYHVEMFLALPGKYDELLRQRRMENAYYRGIDRAPNLIFTHEQGAAWDMFTLGIYRDLKHFAESEDIPVEKKEAAARAAGFKSLSDIGPYLRSLITSHHDTLAVAIP